MSLVDGSVSTSAVMCLSPQDQLKMAASTDFYKKLAVECSAQQIAVDLFAFSSPRRFIDLATLCEYVYAIHAYTLLLHELCTFVLYCQCLIETLTRDC